MDISRRKKIRSWKVCFCHLIENFSWVYLLKKRMYLYGGYGGVPDWQKKIMMKITVSRDNQKNNPWPAMDFDDIDAEFGGVWKTIVYTDYRIFEFCISSKIFCWYISKINY